MVQLSFRPNVRKGKKCDPSDFDRGMICDAIQGGLSISGDFHISRQLQRMV